MSINCNKKIFYFLLIKINFIKYILIYSLSVFFLYSCAPIVKPSEVDIKVIKNGTVEYNSSYIFVIPKVYDFSYSLTYQSILNEVSNKLGSLGLVLVKDFNKAKYAVVVRVNSYPVVNLTSSDLYQPNTNNYPTSWLYENKKPDFLNVPYKFSLDIFLITADKTYTKVMEGYTQQIPNNKINSLTEEKGLLEFIKCSLTALLDKRILNNPSCIEFYYKCWP